jgi:hypothetical protein
VNSDTCGTRDASEWEDIDLIVQTVRERMGRDDERMVRAGARAVYALGKTRMAEIISRTIPSQLIVHLVMEMSDKAFRGLDDQVVSLLLQSEHDTVRKVSALKCVRAWPKTRLAKYFATYMSGDRARYYNIVHWLDFGLSVPRDRALVAARKALDDLRR